MKNFSYYWEPDGYDSYLLVDNRADSEIKIYIKSYVIIKTPGKVWFEAYSDDILLIGSKSFNSVREYAEKKISGGVDLL